MVDTQTARIFAECGVSLRQFSPPREGLVDLSLGLEQSGGAGEVQDVRVVLGDEGFLRPIS